MSFSVRSGETVALVGPSGGGKSSTISLLQHFYTPLSGSILLDNVPLQEYDHYCLHNRMSLVSQEPVLFARDISENIEYGIDVRNKNVIIDALGPENAAGLANAHDFIQSFTDKYKTQVGEKGVQLSGGQKQRVAIARSLNRRPKILLLDEATSALDAESEHLVQQAIYNNLEGRTVILIAHRLSTVEKADRILVINDGQVVQEGSHQQLVNQDGLYRNLVHRQLLGESVAGSGKRHDWDGERAGIPRQSSRRDSASPATSFKSASPLSQSPACTP